MGPDCSVEHKEEMKNTAQRNASSNTPATDDMNAIDNADGIGQADEPVDNAP